MKMTATPAELLPVSHLANMGTMSGLPQAQLCRLLFSTWSNSTGLSLQPWARRVSCCCIIITV